MPNYRARSRWLLALLGVLVVVAVAAMFLTGCAQKSRHKITPGSTRILEIEVPPLVPTPPADPAPLPQTVSLRAFVVMSALAQPSPKHPERPETNAQVQIDGRTINVPPGTKLRLIESQGAGLDTTSDDIGAHWNAEAPTASTPESSASGGGLESAVKLTRLRSSPALVVVVIGCLTVVAGAVAGFLVGWKLGGPMIAAGGLMILLAYLMSDPVLMLGMVALAAVVGLGWAIWHGRLGALDSQALAIVTGAVEKAANGSRTAILSDIKSRMGDRRPTLDKSIRRAKRRAGVS